MIDRKETAQDFYIEEHAALFGFLARSAEKVADGEGLRCVDGAVVTYARERGLRSALRCLKDGRKLTLENYLLYGEWVDIKGWSKTELVSLSPRYKTKTLVCGWYSCWKKYGLEQYGKIYCKWIDKNLLHGFNPELGLEMDTFLTHGDAACEFDWEGSFSDKGRFEEIMSLRAQIAPQVTKDFLYHCGHLASTFKKAFYLGLGLLKGNAVMEGAFGDFEQAFGRPKTEATLEESKLDFLEIQENAD